MTATGYGSNGDLTRVAKAGDTMAGPLLLAEDPVAAMEAATREFVLNNSGGSTSGALLAAHNLSDVASAPSSFANIKQAATTSATGVVLLGASSLSLQPTGVPALGATGTVADLGHTHPDQPWRFLITEYGATGSLQCVIDGQMTSGSAVFTSNSAQFTSAMIGQPIAVKGALSSGQTTLVSTIASWQSATQITLNASATTSASGLQGLWGTDDTVAIQAALNAAVAYDSPFGIAAEIVTPAAPNGCGYMIAGPLKTTDGVNAIYNSQLTIGLNSGRNAGRALIFSGADDAGNTRYWDQDYPILGSSTWFSCGVFSGSSPQADSVTGSGNPSCLGGPTGKNGYGTSLTDPVFNNFTVCLRDMVIMNTHSASGWTYCPFNFHGMARAHLDRCSFGTNGVVQYYKNNPGLGDFSNVDTLSGGISIGGLMPAAGNNASNRIRDCVWNGGFTYGPLWTEHTVGQGDTVLYCWGGFCPVGSYGDGGSGAGCLHAINFGQLAVEGCSYHIIVFGPGESGIGPTLHGILDTEGAIQGRDAPNDGTGLGSAVGEIRVAGSSSDITLTFPTGIKFIREQPLPGIDASPPAITANTAMYNTTGRPANVYLLGGSGVTTIQKSQLMGGQSVPALSTIADFTAAGTLAAPFPVRLQPYQWLKINCSVAPTATWDLD
jgi:hypothetical protein